MLNKIVIILFFLSSALGLYECRKLKKNKQQRIKYHERLEEVKKKAKRQSLWKESLNKEYDDIEERREETYRYLEGFK